MPDSRLQAAHGLHQSTYMSFQIASGRHTCMYDSNQIPSPAITQQSRHLVKCTREWGACQTHLLDVHQSTLRPAPQRLYLA